MLPASIEEFISYDLKHGRQYVFIRDEEHDERVILEEGTLPVKTVALPVFHEIEAGSPILMNDDIHAPCYLPTENGFNIQTKLFS